MQSFEEIDKFHKGLEKYKRKCTNCGHSLYITPKHPQRVCRWCGITNYYDKKIEFKEKLKKALKK